MNAFQNVQVILTKSVAVSLLLLFTYVSLRSVYNVCFHPLRRVPGPFLAKISRLWLFYHDYHGNPHNHIRELHRKLGPLVRISPNEVSVDNVDANNTIYAQNNPWVKPAYHYKAFQSSTAYSIFTELDPQTHAAHSRLLAPAFSQTRVSATDAQRLLWDKCKAMVEGMDDRLGAEKHEDGSSNTITMSLSRCFRSFALDVVTTWTFGHCAESLPTFHSELFEILDVAAESVIYFQHMPFLRALIPYIAPLVPSLVPNKILGQYAKKALESNRAALKGLREIVPCVFSNLVSSQWQEKRGYSPSDGQIISDGIVILAAGADTTAAALSIGIHWLARNPDLWQQLQDELRPVMNSFEKPPRIEALAALPLLNAVLKEGLRVSCPIRGHMPRVVPTEGWNYKGIHFPPGTVVATSAFYGCYNETVFPDPGCYDPMRWLPPKHSSKMEAHLQPFSRGTRQCIGQNLTLAMQRVVIASIVYYFQPVAVDNTTIKTREFVTLLVDSPLEVTLITANRLD
ncbi:cytochrome P450 4A10 [Colletotrichum higginsianum]|uniref:Cytochrome P450 4A10 n=2 Tax=Colletotrichum higginsianum TaxID=80884 RepID=H1V4R6_COLHI|nr:Cytochrome P450 4A10 [Colletotrichum higginsianum IMI 349063]OBR14963.1 Cytochrome P450 4A10 [Colletotrichum higginsianum IMI 349063]TID03662.1 Cytochrome P450 monooxygenase yanH [Colletotrichum higginsianum]CCF35218.1 cytochrome P450 4A10 [Colletotrichum higginsianum]